MSKKISIVCFSTICILITCLTFFPHSNRSSGNNTKQTLMIASEEFSNTTNDKYSMEAYKGELENVPVELEEVIESYIDGQYSSRKYAAISEEIKNIATIEIIEIPEEKPVETVSHGKLTFTYDPNLPKPNLDNIQERFALYAPNDNFDATINALSKMGFGEAGGCSKTEIAATFWNVLNRYDAGYAKSIYGVVTAAGQYHGYKEHHPVKEEIRDLCIDVVARWISEKEGQENVGRILPSDYYWFFGDGRHNHYRNQYRSNVRWDWSLPTPYKD